MNTVHTCTLFQFTLEVSSVENKMLPVTDFGMETLNVLMMDIRAYW